MTEESILVYARVRPCPDPDADFQGVAVDELDPLKLRFDLPPGATSGNSTHAQTYSFSFDSIYWKDSTQEQMFQQVALPLINHSMDGYNSTLFAYGQTGSGKTFTITGDGTTQSMGIVPRAIHYVFDEIKRRPHTKYQIAISYLEIYNNVAFDLLSMPGNQQMQKIDDLKKVQIVDSKNKTIFKDLSVSEAPTLEEAHRLFWAGECTRHKAETVNNKFSSRSHTIFTLYFQFAEEDRIIKSRINFVDLAGSEKYSSLSNEVDQRKLEARHINKSLHTLQTVIIALNNRQSYVPFRDSILTRFLKDSLIGNVKTAMIATISTNQDHLTESISTCRFSESVSEVSTTTRISQEELPPHEMIARLREEVARLRDELNTRSGSGGGGGYSVRGSGIYNTTSSLSGYASQKARLPNDEAEQLKSKIVSFIDDDEELQVTSNAQIQFCFLFMKDLIKKGNNTSALRVSYLQSRLEESERSVAALVHIINSKQSIRNGSGEIGITKEQAYLEFCLAHDKAGILTKLRESLKERCATAKNLNDQASPLRDARAAVQKKVDELDDIATAAKKRIKETEDPEEKQDCELQIEKAQEEKKQILPDLDKAIMACNKNYDDLRSCKEEVIALQRELSHTRAMMEQDFESFWVNTIMRYSLHVHAQTPKSRKAAQPLYSTLHPPAISKPT